MEVREIIELMAQGIANSQSYRWFMSQSEIKDGCNRDANDEDREDATKALEMLTAASFTIEQWIEFEPDKLPELTDKQLLLELENGEYVVGVMKGKKENGKLVFSAFWAQGFILSYVKVKRYREI